MPTSFKPSARRPAERSSSTNGLLQLAGLALVVVLLAGWVVYVVYFRVDDKAILDKQIEEGWMNGRETVDAMAYFENGGVYENRDAPGAKDIDQQYVIPLIKQLRDKHHLEVLVVVQDKLRNTAMAVLAEAPADRKTRNEVRRTILDMTESFPGLATQNWSHRWVSLDFFDKEESEVFHRSGAFDKLKESQRQME